MLAVAARARAAARGTDGKPARGRTLTRSGRWLALYGSMISQDDSQVAVIIEPAGPRELAVIIMSVYGLSAREREITRLVLRGLSTDEIAATMNLSPYTVQDYLKTIFDKVGVRSRGQLTAVIFRDHYEPRAWRTDHPAPAGWFADSTPSRQPPPASRP